MSDKIKTLSQAIKLGATFRPQCRAFYYKNGESCAIGAAYEATFHKLPDNHAGLVCAELRDRYSMATNGNLFTTIILRNDHSRQTREEIAEWLESIGF